MPNSEIGRTKQGLGNQINRAAAGLGGTRLGLLGASTRFGRARGVGAGSGAGSVDTCCAAARGRGHGGEQTSGGAYAWTVRALRVLGFSSPVDFGWTLTFSASAWVSAVCLFFRSRFCVESFFLKLVESLLVSFKSTGCLLSGGPLGKLNCIGNPFFFF